MSSHIWKSRRALALGAFALLLVIAAAWYGTGGGPNQAPTPPDTHTASDQRSPLDSDAEGRIPQSIVDPTEPRDVSGMDLFSSRPGSDVAYSAGPEATVEEVLEKGLQLAEASPVHIAVRGTADADSVRCDWRGIARTAEQRNEAIRFWLGLDEDDDIPDATFLEALFTATIDVLEPAYLETAKSNFMTIVEGGLSTEYLFLTCHADYTPSEYLLGAGPLSPNKLTVAYDRRGEAPSYDLYRREYNTSRGIRCRVKANMRVRCSRSLPKPSNLS